MSPERLMTGRIHNLGEVGRAPDGTPTYMTTMDIIVSAHNVSSHPGRFFDDFDNENAALNTPEVCDALIEQALDSNSIFRRAEFGRYVVSADKQDIIKVIIAMKAMIRAAEDVHKRTAFTTVNESAPVRAPSTNPLEQWLTGGTSPTVKSTKPFEETSSPLLFASRTPVLRHGALNHAF